MSYGLSLVLDGLGERGLTGSYVIGLMSRGGKIGKDCPTIETSLPSLGSQELPLSSNHSHIIDQGVQVDVTLKFPDTYYRD